MSEPALTVVVLSYNARERIDRPLLALRRQRSVEPIEVVVVDSGSDDCASYVASAYPWARVERSETRLLPGATRNRGVAAARGRWVAFLADDCAVRPDWAARRIARHREGWALVGGAVVNGARLSPVATAAYLLEYSAVIPSARVLAEQEIPHGLSYERRLFDELGGFPEDTLAGEDTAFNRRCLAAGASWTVDPRVAVVHRPASGVAAFLRHQYGHGRALYQVSGGALPATGREMLVRYPARRWWNALRRLGRGGRRWVVPFLVLSPLVWAGLWAAGLGYLAEGRRAAGASGAGPTELADAA